LAAPYIAADPATPVAAAIDGRHRHVYFELFGTDGRVLLSPRMRLAEAACGVRCIRVWWAGAATRASATGAAPQIDERGAPDIEWVARLGAGQTNDSRQAALSARRRSPSADRDAGAAPMRWLRPFARAPAAAEAALRDAAAAICTASFRRGWSEDEIESMLTGLARIAP
jgi:hypothetical protein